MIYAFVAVIIIIFILCAPVRAQLSFKDQKASGKLYLWKIPIYKKSVKEKKAEGRTKSSPEEKVKTFQKSSKKLSERIRTFSELRRNTVRLIKKYIKLETVSVDISFGTGEAASTAIGVGLLWGAVYSVLGNLGRIIFVNKHDIKINPDYQKATFKTEGKCIIRSRIVYIIIIAITILIKIKFRRNKNGRASD